MGYLVTLHVMLMTVRTRFALLALVFWTALPALAMRLEFVAQSGGARMPGAEVCFVQAGGKSDRPNLYLGSDDVRCLSADEVIDVTPGKWAYFLRQRDGLVSMLPGTVTIPARSDEVGYKEVIADMRTAATIDVAAVRAKLQPGEILVVYIRHDGHESIPAAFPIGKDVSDMLVPAGLPLVVLSVRDGRVTNASDPITLKRLERRSVGFPPTSVQRSTVVAWLRVADEARQPAPFWKSILAPQATLTRGTETISPQLSPADGFGADGALLIFRQVGAGSWALHLRGDTWRPDELPLEVSGAVAEASRHIVTEPAAGLRLRWSAGAAPAALDPTCLPHAMHAGKPDALSVRLYTCDGLRADASVDTLNAARCRAASFSAAINEKARTAAFRAIPAGVYLAEVREPGLPPARVVVSASIGEVTTADAELRSFDFFGRVTLDDAPLRSRLEFRTGRTVSDESGRFTAHLDADPGPSPIRVVRCESDQTLSTYIPAKPIERGQPYDIAIGTNTLRVQVIDASTRKPIAAATVQPAAMMDASSDTASFLAPVAPTDDNGTTEASNVPTAFAISVCAEKDGYERQCGDRFSMRDERAKSVTVALAPLKNAGVIHAAHPFHSGRVFFVAAGHVSEAADIAPDGTFHCKADHVAPEYVVVTSANLPLFSAPLPLQAAASLEFTEPTAGRTISVGLADTRTQSDALLGLVVDGRYVPSEALFNHQARRGDPMFILKRAPVVLPDIAAQSIAVMLGPSPYEIAPAEPDDIFTRAERRSATVTKVAGPNGIIVFE